MRWPSPRVDVLLKPENEMEEKPETGWRKALLAWLVMAILIGATCVIASMMGVKIL